MARHAILRDAAPSRPAPATGPDTASSPALPSARLLRQAGPAGTLARASVLARAAGLDPVSVDEGSSNAAMRRLHRRMGGGGPAGPDLDRALSEAGRALPRGLRERLEAVFEHPLGHVRIHTGDTAATAAHDLNAHAFALGSHIYFGRGSWAPGTPEGDRVLVHELTHVVQHDEGRLPTAPSGELRVSSPSDPAEKEAEANERLLAPRLASLDPTSAPETARGPGDRTEGPSPATPTTETPVEDSTDPSSAAVDDPLTAALEAGDPAAWGLEDATAPSAATSEAGGTSAAPQDGTAHRIFAHITAIENIFEGSKETGQGLVETIEAVPDGVKAVKNSRKALKGADKALDALGTFAPGAGVPDLGDEEADTGVFGIQSKVEKGAKELAAADKPSDFLAGETAGMLFDEVDKSLDDRGYLDNMAMGSQDLAVLYMGLVEEAAEGDGAFDTRDADHHDQIPPVDARYEILAHEMAYLEELALEHEQMLARWGYDPERAERYEGEHGFVVWAFYIDPEWSPEEAAEEDGPEPIAPLDVLAFRGTDSSGGVLDDANEFGVGHFQWSENRTEVIRLLGEASGPVAVVGHSLGGALAQRAAIDEETSGSIAEVVTFQAPGLSEEDAAMFDQRQQERADAGLDAMAVRHHASTEDLVDKAGERHIGDGTGGRFFTHHRMDAVGPHGVMQHTAFLVGSDERQRGRGGVSEEDWELMQQAREGRGTDRVDESRNIVLEGRKQKTPGLMRTGFETVRSTAGGESQSDPDRRRGWARWTLEEGYGDMIDDYIW